MIEVLDFYAKGAHLVVRKREFSNLTFTTSESLEELGFIPSDKSKKNKKPAAHLVHIDNGDVLVLKGGHKYVVTINETDIEIDATSDHKVLNVSDDVIVKTVEDGLDLELIV